MITKQDIIEFGHSFSRRQRGRRDRRLIHPRREWFIGLCGFVFVVIGGAGYAVWLYVSYADMSYITGVAATTPPTYQEEVAEAVLEQFQARAATYQELTNQYAQLTAAPVVEPLSEAEESVAEPAPEASVSIETNESFSTSTATTSANQAAQLSGE